MSSRAPPARAQSAAGFDGLAALRTLLPRARAAFAAPSKRPPGAAPRAQMDPERVRRFDSLPTMRDATREAAAAAATPARARRRRHARASEAYAAVAAAPAPAEKDEGPAEGEGEEDLRAEGGRPEGGRPGGGRPEGGRVRLSDGWRAFERRRTGGGNDGVEKQAAASSSAAVRSAGPVDGSRDGKKRAHHAPNGGFVNPWQSAPLRSGGRGMAAVDLGVAEPVESSVDDATLASLLLLSARPDFAAADAAVALDRRAVVAHWLGHSTFVIHTAGMVLLTDPVWADALAADTTGGSDAPGARRQPWKRLVPPPCDLDKLPAVIDAVLLSGAAADHFDAAAAAWLAPRVRRWIVPLGLAAPLRAAGVDVATLSEMDWWGETMVLAREPGRGAARIVCTPAQARSPQRDALWCAWHITLPGGRSLYFCGAGGIKLQSVAGQRVSRTSLCPAFRDVRHRYGKVDVALLPVGGGGERSPETAQFNMNARDVLLAHLELHARKTVVHRWGTFDSPGEPPLGPVRELENALLDSHTVSEHDVAYISHGHMHKC